MFKTSCNLVAIWGKTEVNMANKQNESHWNRHKFTLATKVAFKSATKITSKIACVIGPLCSELS